MSTSNATPDRSNSGQNVYASDIAVSASKAANKRPTEVKLVRKGLEDSGGFTSEERAATFRVAFALSMSDAFAKGETAKALFPKTLAIREKLKAKKVACGKGYTRSELTEATKAIGSGMKYSAFSAFRPSGTRYNVVEDGDRLKLYIVTSDGSQYPTLPKDEVIEQKES